MVSWVPLAAALGITMPLVISYTILGITPAATAVFTHIFTHILGTGGTIP
ncbi:MAG: hypothetical protein MPK75_00270 [Alphaproteobacteria bacterium]|nr:hypothetical protein [Alphaproteobacteria bacterium]